MAAGKSLSDDTKQMKEIEINNKHLKKHNALFEKDGDRLRLLQPTEAVQRAEKRKLECNLSADRNIWRRFIGEANCIPFVNCKASQTGRLTVGIEYETSPDSSALFWLSPLQTAGKQHPYLYSQCEPIHARSFVPCQDSPGVKFPYTAKVTVLKEFVVLMSALQQSSNVCRSNSSKMEFFFKQPVPIPSYLIAIVVGDLASRNIGPRSKVWSETEFLDKAAFEFSETEEMLKVAENLMGPYVWSQYDLVVLPPSFPYGGMENPCLTFVTPTLLAGDKSLANVIAHEISHSWTGNLVTNSTFEHFWLNEGHTTFVERKICAKLGCGEPLRNLLGMIGKKSWADYVNNPNTKPNFTRLVPELKGVSPDDSFSSVPYEKGYALLYYLEDLVGGPEVFEPFLKAYIEHFKYHSINSHQWKEFLLSYFTEKGKGSALRRVNWNDWFFETGMPAVPISYQSCLADACQQLSEIWCSTGDSNFGQFSSSDLDQFSTPQTLEFLNQLMEQDPFSLTKIAHMESAYHLFSQGNSEILFRWLRLCLRAKWNKCIPHAVSFINKQGRLKFLLPIYELLYQWEDTRQLAIDNFQEHKEEMHNLAVTKISKMLKLT
ncbi:leukotriene A-4 hydrolase-like [Octopus sinensis]|uniref:Leukotriene A-4 hydrolase-like n=1 Tax=Octopus sinensis TaxID=2607531 RepID=A0A7E6FLF6_9MOLL|nr:leukotriene A-4 hydrolase-like [Octopus sinensis]